jgi:flagellar protein FlaG
MQSISSVGPAPAVGAASPQNPRSGASPNASAAAPAGRSGTGGGQAGASAATAAQVKAAVEEANRQLDQSNRELTFVFDDKLGRMLVKIVDTRTNTVIRQVPSDEMLAAARALSGSSTRGALLRGKA